eukprot:m.183922 g.183922  ORF g.183922 m.183922 type:complete len:122 (-) comp16900_c0_seq3:264-629(-)
MGRGHKVDGDGQYRMHCSGRLGDETRLETNLFHCSTCVSDDVDEEWHTPCLGECTIVFEEAHRGTTELIATSGLTGPADNLADMQLVGKACSKDASAFTKAMHECCSLLHLQIVKMKQAIV